LCPTRQQGRTDVSAFQQAEGGERVAEGVTRLLRRHLRQRVTEERDTVLAQRSCKLPVQLT